MTGMVYIWNNEQEDDDEDEEMDSATLLRNVGTYLRTHLDTQKATRKRLHDIHQPNQQ